MRTIGASIDVDAPPDAVWAVLADVEAYPLWNPLIRRVSGTVARGEQVSMRVRLAGLPLVIRPTILEVAPPWRLRWRGELPIPGLCTGLHSFELEPLPGGGTRLTHGERLSGALVPVLGPLFTASERGFAAMDRALKERVEAGRPARAGDGEGAGVRPAGPGASG